MDWNMRRVKLAIRMSVALALIAAAHRNASGDEVDYLTQVKPILSRRCYGCHGAFQQRSEFRLDTAALLRKGGESGAGLIPGNAQDSRIIQVVTGDAGFRMPP